MTLHVSTSVWVLLLHLNVLLKDPIYQPFVKSNQIDRFARAPHHQSSGAPNIMTLNRDKNITNKKEKRLKPEQGVKM